MSSAYKLTLSTRTLEDADPQAKPVLEQVKASMGMIPNMYSDMANSPSMLQSYAQGYSSFRDESGFTPAEQEVVFLTISRENECHYCMAAHSFVADNISKVPVKVTNAIRDGQPITDNKLAALSTFSRTMFLTRGHPSKDDVANFLLAGYSETHILSIILALAVKTISNYSNHVFDTSVDPAFASRTWDKLKSQSKVA
ncbi:carboxymuconolactone decarboxylase family protein [uncultured Paraglaciecola sp.]|uniref:carboxymuconolactone decarboxylase family protein n=1 Tax=uncultured Paraglaciecola sp. TaxID=1765024 RepID=UPI0025E4CC08|nr:carboxymuconolactone decarboxylase family protein [uncultured Paraglaciecola sp.]